MKQRLIQSSKHSIAHATPSLTGLRIVDTIVVVVVVVVVIVRQHAD
jgi:hypothetical protein